MKIRISATIEKETDEILNELMKEKDYRNKSHIIERAIQFLKEEKHDKRKRRV